MTMTEAQTLAALTQLSREVTSIIEKAQALQKEPCLPYELKPSLTEFINYLDDTLSDCNLAGAVERYEEAQALVERRELKAHRVAAE